MTARSSHATLTTGPAAAALIAMGLGLLALGVCQVLSEASEAFKQTMQSLGNLWMPGAPGIGPYSGKETAALLVWLISWGLLDALLKKRDVNLVTVGVVTLALVGLATTILWPPITHLLLH
jgi:hypothetical protein